MTFSTEEISKACDNMQKYGGSFTEHLGRALAHADMINRAKIVATWPELIKKYKDFGHDN